MHYTYKIIHGRWQIDDSKDKETGIILLKVLMADIK
jgi:hypothetical protein